MPEVNIADGDVVTGADFDSIDDQLIITCTSSTRPTGVEGRHIFETDTNKRYVYDGTSWNLDGGSGWVTFTPSWTNLTVGNGTNVGRYRYADGGVYVAAQVGFGSTTSISGSVSLTIPNSETAQVDPQGMGWAIYLDSGTRWYLGGCWSISTATRLDFLHNEGGNAGLVNATNPFTWATGDILAANAFVRL